VLYVCFFAADRLDFKGDGATRSTRFARFGQALLGSPQTATARDRGLLRAPSRGEVPSRAVCALHADPARPGPTRSPGSSSGRGVLPEASAGARDKLTGLEADDLRRADGVRRRGPRPGVDALNSGPGTRTCTVSRGQFHVLIPEVRDHRVRGGRTAGEVERRYGIQPGSLVQDSSRCVAIHPTASPEHPECGPKTAADLRAGHGSLGEGESPGTQRAAADAAGDERVGLAAGVPRDSGR